MQRRRSRLIAGIIGSLLCLPSMLCAQKAGNIVGNIDGIRLESDGYYLLGWACQQGIRDSIGVHLYADRSAFDTRPGTFVVEGEADLGSEPAVAQRCQDTKGGKHRFKVAIPNQLLRTFQKRKLYVHGIAVAGKFENAAIAGSGTMRFPEPKWPIEPQNPKLLDGPRVAVFDTAKDSCEQIDIPDAMARAFRDYKGVVHLVASHYVMRAALGPSLESAKHNCQVAYNSRHDPKPAHFDDTTWLDAFYNIDGKRIVALGHMEYHGWEHSGMCTIKNNDNPCWYTAATFLLSEDGGYHFAPPKSPPNFVVGVPYKYEINQGPEGYSIDTNIVKAGEWYYAMVTDWPWPPDCDDTKKARPCLVPFGVSPIRTSNIEDPASWRGWDGKEFAVAFVDPYQGSVARPRDHVYTPVPTIYNVNGINFHQASHRFIATLFDPWNDAFGPPGLYFSTSPDMVHWSKPALGITVNQLLEREPEGNWSYLYFSLIDPNSTDANFSTVTDNPYLYYVRLDDSHGPYQRVLFRQKIKLDWLFTSGQTSASRSSPLN
jgi:hypothetical protein